MGMRRRTPSHRPERFVVGDRPFEMHIRIDKNLREVKHWLQRSHEQQVHLFTTYCAEEMRMYGYSEDETYTTDRELGELR
jgi:hypothetical protein